VTAGISADMRHQHGNAFACETVRRRPYPSEQRIVYVAVNGPERFEGRDFVGERGGTDVARMPYFVYIGEEVPQRSIENPVRVRYDSDFFHCCKDKPDGGSPCPCSGFLTNYSAAVPPPVSGAARAEDCCF